MLQITNMQQYKPVHNVTVETTTVNMAELTTQNVTVLARTHTDITVVENGEMLFTRHIVISL